MCVYKRISVPEDLDIGTTKPAVERLARGLNGLRKQICVCEKLQPVCPGQIAETLRLRMPTEHDRVAGQELRVTDHGPSARHLDHDCRIVPAQRGTDPVDLPRVAH